MNGLLAYVPATHSREPPPTKLLAAPPTVEFCETTDVLLKFRAIVQPKVYRETIEEWADEYIQAQARNKAPVIEAVRSLLEERGCRFIKPGLAVPESRRLVQETDKIKIRNKITTSLRYEQRKRRKSPSPNKDDADTCTGKATASTPPSPETDNIKIKIRNKITTSLRSVPRKKKKSPSPIKEDADTRRDKAAASTRPSPEPTVNLVPGPPKGLTSSDKLAWIQYYFPKDPTFAPSKETVHDDGDAKTCKGKAEGFNLVPGPPQGLTSSDTLAWMQHCFEKDPVLAPLKDTQYYFEKDPVLAPLKDTVHDDDDDTCIGKAAVSTPQPPESTVNLVPGPPLSLTSSDTLAWIQYYFPRDPALAPMKETVPVSPETLPEDFLITEPLPFAITMATPAAKTTPTSILTQFPVQGGTGTRQQLFQDHLPPLQSKAMATTTTTLPMEYTDGNSDNYNECLQGLADTTTGSASLRFLATPEAAAAAAAAAVDQTMTIAQGGGGMAHDYAHSINGHAHSATDPHPAYDPSLQVYLDRMQYLEDRVLVIRESNSELLDRIASIEAKTYW